MGKRGYQVAEEGVSSRRGGGIKVAEEGVSSRKRNFLSALQADFSGVKIPRITRITSIFSTHAKRRGSFLRVL